MLTFLLELSGTIQRSVAIQFRQHPQSQDACYTLLLPARTKTTTHFSRSIIFRPVVIARAKDEVLLVLLVVEAAIRLHSVLGDVLDGSAVTSKSIS